MMKFEYNRFFLEGGAEEFIKRLNELGAEGWEVVGVTDVNRESAVLSPMHAVWVKRESRKKLKDD